MLRGIPAFIAVLPIHQSSYEKNPWSPQKATSSPPGVSPGQFYGGRRGRGSILGELDLVGPFNDTKDRLGAFDLDGAGPGEVRPQLQLTPYGLEYGGISMAERHRTQTHAILDELVAVQVPDMAATPPLNEGRGQLGKLVVAFRVGVAAAGDKGVASLSDPLLTADADEEAPSPGFPDRQEGLSMGLDSL